MFKPALIGHLFILGILLPSLHAQEAEVVSSRSVATQYGPVRGVRLDDGITVFRGIPFAAPPVGELRWRPPQPPAKWEDVRNCERFGDVAWQDMSRRTNPPSMNENCLFLNIWSGNVGDEPKRPVMVWIHGGGLNQGWGSQAKYDGTSLAQSGVVCVSINYRLGPLGFLAHPGLSAESAHGVSGNYGFMDQLESLKWIQENISNFGGDPDNVTIFGESAGGTSVAALCASPHARGLFHRAILQSPWMFGYINRLAEANIVPLSEPTTNTPSAEELGQQWAKGFVEETGRKAVEALRAIPAEKLVVGEEYYKTRVTIDGWFLPDHPVKVFSEGKQADVPMMIGTTKDEGNYFAFAVPQRRSKFDARLKDCYGTRTGPLLEFYSGDSKQAVRLAGMRFVTDAWFVHPARQLLEGMTKVQSRAFQYQFAVSHRNNPDWGSPHAIELQYVFGTLDSDALPIHQEVSRTMVRYWTQFAKTGDPNTTELASWPAYDDTEPFLRIGEQCEVDRQMSKQACDLLDQATN